MQFGAEAKCSWKRYTCWGKLVLKLERVMGRDLSSLLLAGLGALPMLSCLSFTPPGSRGPLTPILITSFSPDHKVIKCDWEIWYLIIASLAIRTCCTEPLKFKLQNGGELLLLRGFEDQLNSLCITCGPAFCCWKLVGFESCLSALTKQELKPSQIKVSFLESFTPPSLHLSLEFCDCERTLRNCGVVKI